MGKSLKMDIEKYKIKKIGISKTINLLGQKTFTKSYLFTPDDGSENIIVLEKFRVVLNENEKLEFEVVKRKFWFGILLQEGIAFKQNTLLSHISHLYK